MSDLVTLTLDGDLGIITLNRPNAANALSTEVMEAIIAKAQAVSRESAVRVVILTGPARGRASEGPPGHSPDHPLRRGRRRHGRRRLHGHSL
jgi:enoyl-CoA hydratase/carnithine racemase